MFSPYREINKSFTNLNVTTMKQPIYEEALSSIQKEEGRISLEPSKVIEGSYKMTLLLKDLLSELKEHVLVNGFADSTEEIYFFKNVKPQVLGKLIYYNKVYRIETSCPVNTGKLYYKYFTSELEGLKQEYKEHLCNSEFYRYYRSGRSDLDDKYFRLGNIDFHGGLNSIVFEIDPQFSTYYDYKVSRIIANDLLYNYLLLRINAGGDEPAPPLRTPNKDVFWTDSKNALIELIYALHASGAISHGRTGITKISLIFQILFRVQLGDLHHAFHRMKDRAGSKTAFIDHLKTSLEHYMDKNL